MGGWANFKRARVRPGLLCTLNDFVREVVVEKIDFLYNFCHFLAIFANFRSFFAIFTLFGAFSLCTVGAFLVVFPIFVGFVGIFSGTPVNYFVDFGAIVAIFDHFWTIFFCLF